MALEDHKLEEVLRTPSETQKAHTEFRRVMMPEDDEEERQAWKEAKDRARYWRELEKERGTPYTIEDGWTTPLIVTPPAVDRQMIEVFGEKSWRQVPSLMYKCWKAYPEFRCSNKYWWRKQ